MRLKKILATHAPVIPTSSSAASEAGPQPERYIALSKVKEICERIMKASNDLVNDSAEYRIGQWSGAEKAMWEIDCAALAGGKDATQAVQSGPDVAGATPAVAAPSEEKFIDPITKAFIDGWVACKNNPDPGPLELYELACAYKGDEYVAPREGWKLVPVEPTEAMVEAGVKDSRPYISYVDAEDVYRVMCAAAPEAK